jgi:hypothetical protein
VDEGIDSEGSNLSGVTSRCSWEENSGRDSRSYKYDDDKENRTNNDKHGRHENDKLHISQYGKCRYAINSGGGTEWSRSLWHFKFYELAVFNYVQ